MNVPKNLASVLRRVFTKSTKLANLLQAGTSRTIDVALFHGPDANWMVSG